MKIIIFIKICGPIISTKTIEPTRVALLEDLSVMFLHNHWKFPLIYGYFTEGDPQNSIKAVKAFSARSMPITIVNSTRSTSTSRDPMLILLNEARDLTDALRNVEAWKMESVIIALMYAVENVDDLKTTVIDKVEGKHGNFYITFFRQSQGNKWQVLSVLSTPRFKMPVITDQHFAPGSMVIHRKPYDLRGETVSDVTLDFEPYVSSLDCPLNPTPGCDMVGFFIDYFAAAASMANFRLFSRHRSPTTGWSICSDSLVGVILTVPPSAWFRLG